MQSEIAVGVVELHEKFRHGERLACRFVAGSARRREHSEGEWKGKEREQTQPDTC
jgi:hypothetical protein